VRILVVDDNDINQQIAKELFESAGATVSIAHNGAEAVKVLTENSGPPSFDVVFMDMQMPEMDGITATKLLRRDPRLRNLPIIAMTAHALVEDRQHCLDEGMNDHVSKPIDPDALFSTLSRWVKPRPTQEKGIAAIDAGSSDAVTPMDIAGINVASGLRRVAGNEHLYRDLLMRFVLKQAKASEDLSAALANGNNKEAERIVHTIKGVAGNLGIADVQAAALALDTAIHEGREFIPAMLDTLTRTMRRQAEAITRALQQTTPAAEKESQAFPYNEAVASEAITRLRKLLETSDGSAEEAFRDLLKSVDGAVDKAPLDSLRAFIDEFDFEAALAKLEEIAHTCARYADQTK
jgi:CheY-like chemotaxis protein